MASSPHRIRRVPVPVRHPAPAPASASTSPSSSSQTLTQTGVSSPSLPSTSAPVIIRGQHQPRAPIQLVNTHSHQLLPAHGGHGSNSHHHQHPHQYSSHTIQMDSEAKPLPHPLPGHVEEDIKAAVMASMPLSTISQPPETKVLDNILSRKFLRWLSLSLSIFVVVGETVATIMTGFTDDVIFAYVWAPLLGAWNAWRLFRLRKKANKEVISYWHLSGEISFLAVTLFLLVFVITWTLGQVSYIYYIFWRAVATAVAFFIWLVLHTTILVLTVIEMWRRHKAASMPLPIDAGGQPQQPQQLQLQQLQQPQIIVQYIPTCPHCHTHVEPQPGENKNALLASIGDLQPQAVAPAYLVQGKNHRTREAPT